MDWTTPHFLQTLTGYHVALWLAAYAAWRYLTAAPRRAARSAAPPVSQARVCRPTPAVLVNGRYERRPERIAAYQAEAAKSSARRAA